MRDIALDPVTGDLLIEDGALRLTTEAEAVAQGLDLGLNLWQGEWGRDRRVGMPYRQLLGRKGAGPTLAATIRAAIATAPGVGSVAAFSYVVGADRVMRVRHQVRAASGALLPAVDFVVGGEA